jgi:lipid II:glycine glycyltransferase (peptidoglycan interpeptide bridge formation enzyme)
MHEDFARIIIARDKVTQLPHSVWLGVVMDETIYDIWGGNTDFSLENYGQYLTHLTAIAIAVKEDLRYYDLGGYDPNKGYGKYKDGLRPIVRNFLGPIDIVLEKNKYKAINLSQKLSKVFKF